MMLRKLLLLAAMAVMAFAFSASSALAGNYQLLDEAGNPVATGTELEAELEPGTEGLLDGESPNLNIHCDIVHLESNLTSNAAVDGVEAVIPGSGDTHDPNYEVLFQSTGHAANRCESSAGECLIDVEGFPDHIVVREDPAAGKSVNEPEIIVEQSEFDFSCSGIDCEYRGRIEGKVDDLGDAAAHIPPHAVFPNPNQAGSASVSRIHGSGFFCPAVGHLIGEIELVEPEIEISATAEGA